MLRKVFSSIESIGADPDDTDNIRVQKSLLVVSTFVMLSLGVIWGLIYIWLGESFAGFIPLSYAMFSFASLVFFIFSRNIKFFRTTQLILIMLLPFLVMMALGGFIDGSAVVVWAISGPLYALFFFDYQKSYRWLLAYFFLVVISGFLPPFLPFTNQLPPEVVNLFFVLNLSGISLLIFVMVYYYIDQSNKMMQLLKQIVTLETNAHGSSIEKEALMNGYLQEAKKMIILFHKEKKERLDPIGT